MTSAATLDVLCRAIDAQGSRAEFARKIEMSDNYLSMILSGDRPLDRLPLETVKRISDAADIPLDTLAGKQPTRKKVGAR